MKEKISSVVLGPDGKPVAGVQGAILKAIGVQRPLVLAYIRRLRRRHPRLNGAELAKLIERDYLVAVTGGGAAVGATAVVPGVGTAASLGLSAAATVGFLEASALYAQSMAELHGITTEDPEKSRVLVMAILMGDEGSSMIAALTHQAAGKGAGPVKGWGAVFGSAKPSGAWGTVRSQIQKRFLKRMLASQGAGIIGRAIPFGIGAAVGGVGNRFLGRKVIQAAALAFGPVPDTIPGELAADAGAAQDPHDAGAAQDRHDGGPAAIVPAGRPVARDGARGAAGDRPSVQAPPGADDDAARRRAAQDVERGIEEERRRRGAGRGS